MSVEIWINIRDAIREVGTADQAKEFELCRNKEAILTFLTKHFKLDPLKLLPKELVWEDQPMTQVPDILRKVFPNGSLSLPTISKHLDRDL